MSAPRFYAALVGRSGETRYVSVRLFEPIYPEEVEFLGLRYRYTQPRTNGGWLIYKEK